MSLTYYFQRRQPSLSAPGTIETKYALVRIFPFLSRLGNFALELREFNTLVLPAVLAMCPSYVQQNVQHMCANMRVQAETHRDCIIGISTG